jgi:uncharacterized protein (UPF0332 family)
MNPRDFHDLALDLLGRDDATGYRTAISRAYYAVYHVALGLLTLEAGCRIASTTAHGDVMTCLCNAGDQDAEQVGTMLGNLQSMRIAADYRLTCHDVENADTAKSQVADAANMICTLDALADAPERLTTVRNTLRSRVATKHLAPS